MRATTDLEGRNSDVPGRVIGALAALVIVGALLRLYRLDHQSLWNDEIVTYISSVGSPWRVITQRVENSNIPPLYYLVANAGLLLRSAAGVELALRLPSVLFGVLTIPLLFIVVRPWLGPRLALLSAACATVSPFHIWYSQEARPYALLLFLSLLALVALERALRDSARPGWKVATAFSLAATFYCHTVGLAFIGFAAAYVAAALWSRARTTSGTRASSTSSDRATGAQARQWIATFLAVAVLCLPAVYRLVSFPPTNSADAERALSPLQLAYTLWSFVVGFSFGPSLGELHAIDRHVVIARYAAWIVPVALAIAVVLLRGGWIVTRRDRVVARTLALWFVFPIAFVVAGALLTTHPFNVRYAVISFLPTIVVLAIGLDALRPTGVRVVGWVALAVVSAVALLAYYDNPKYARDDNRGAAQFLATHAAANEVIVVHRAFTAKDLRFYAPADSSRIVPYPPGDERLTQANVDRDLPTITNDAPRFWLFLSRGTPDEVAPLLTYCAQTYRRDSAASFVSVGVDVVACVRRGPAR